MPTKKQIDTWKRTTAVKTQELGMHFCTATNRLKKIVLFDLLKKQKKNKCFRCKKTIINVEDLTVDHIKPWFHVSVKLFWDLKNIAFSHSSCNIKAAKHKKLKD